MWKVGVGGLLVLAAACGQSVKDGDDTGAGGSSALGGSESGGSSAGDSSTGGSSAGGASSGGSNTGGASSGGSSTGGSSGSGAMGGASVSGTGPGGAGAGAAGGTLAGSGGNGMMGGAGGTTSGAGGSSAGVGGSAGNGMAGSGGSSEPPLAMNVQACEIIGGLNRVRFGGSVQSAGSMFCAHVALVQPGTAPDGLVLPDGWGVEFAAAWPAASGSCLARPQGAVTATSVVGEVSFVTGGTIDTLDAEVTLTFGTGAAPPNARFSVEALDVGGGCS